MTAYDALRGWAARESATLTVEISVAVIAARRGSSPRMPAMAAEIVSET
jgi:hypothetical protein